jgi:hypothetical protein
MERQSPSATPSRSRPGASGGAAHHQFRNLSAYPIRCGLVGIWFVRGRAAGNVDRPAEHAAPLAGQATGAARRLVECRQRAKERQMALTGRPSARRGPDARPGAHPFRWRAQRRSDEQRLDSGWVRSRRRSVDESGVCRWRVPSMSTAGERVAANFSVSPGQRLKMTLAMSAARA